MLYKATPVVWPIPGLISCTEVMWRCMHGDCYLMHKMLSCTHVWLHFVHKITVTICSWWGIVLHSGWLCITSMCAFFLQRAMVHCSCIACVCVYIYIWMYVCGDPCSLVHMHALHISFPQGLHPCGSHTSCYHLCYTIHCECLWASWTMVVCLHTNHSFCVHWAYSFVYLFCKAGFLHAKMERHLFQE